MKSAAATAFCLSLAAARTAPAGDVYLALGGSITFDETGLTDVPSYGDLGDVGRCADFLATQYGDRPEAAA